MSQIMQRSNTRLDLPVEILLDLLSHMDRWSIIKLAQTCPEVLLGPRLNVFILDAKKQVANSQIKPIEDRLGVSGPCPHLHGLSTCDDKIPLIYTAIQKGADASVIRKILTAYLEVCPTSIDGIWSESTKPDYTLLHFAVSLGRPDLVSLLLELGANTDIFLSVHWTYSDTHKCIHTKSEQQNGKLKGSAMNLALQHEWPKPGTDSQLTNNIEECAMLLYAAGTPLLQHKCDPEDFAHRCHDEDMRILECIIERGLFRVLRTIIDQFLADENDKERLREILRTALVAAVRDQICDGDRRIIDYLLNAGAPLIVEEPTWDWLDEYEDDIGFWVAEGTVPFEKTLVQIAIKAGCPETAIFFLGLYMESQMPIEWSEIEFPDPYFAKKGMKIGKGSSNTKNIMAVVQALHTAMSKSADMGLAFFRGEKATVEILHLCLLTELLGGKYYHAINWVVDRGLGLVEKANWRPKIRWGYYEYRLTKPGRRGRFSLIRDQSIVTKLQRAVVDLYESSMAKVKGGIRDDVEWRSQRISKSNHLIKEFRWKKD